MDAILWTSFAISQACLMLQSESLFFDTDQPLKMQNIVVI